MQYQVKLIEINLKLQKSKCLAGHSDPKFIFKKF